MTIGSDGAGETSACSEVRDLSTDGRAQPTHVGMRKCFTSTCFIVHCPVLRANSSHMLYRCLRLSRPTIDIGHLHLTIETTVQLYGRKHDNPAHPCWIGFGISLHDLSNFPPRLCVHHKDACVIPVHASTTYIPLHLGITNAMSLLYRMFHDFRA